MNIENVISNVPMNTPAENISNLRYDLKAFSLAQQILTEITNGSTVEQSIQKRLTVSDDSSLSQDVAMLEAGVEDAYKAMDGKVDKEWVTTHLNSTLMNMDNVQRAAYLKNVLTLVAQSQENSTQDKAREIIARLDNTSDLAENDIHAALELLFSMLDQGAGVLQRSSVEAMDKLMARLPQEVVVDLAEQGPLHAKARAAAAYILRCSGEGREQDAEATPYQMGVSAVTAVESSRLLSLYYKGKIRLDYLCDRLHQLFASAVTLLLDNLLTILAVGIQVVTGITLLGVFSELMSGTFAVILATYISTCFITNKDIRETLEFFWNVAVSVWERAKSLLSRIFLAEEVNNTVFMDESQQNNAAEVVNAEEVSAALETQTEDADDETSEEDSEEAVEDTSW